MTRLEQIKQTYADYQGFLCYDIEALFDIAEAALAFQQASDDHKRFSDDEVDMMASKLKDVCRDFEGKV